MVILGLCLVSSCKKAEDKPAPPPPEAPKADPVVAVPKPPVAPPATGNCAAGTTLTALDSAKDISKAGPFDLLSFTFAKAQWDADRSTLKVYVSNKDWSLERLNSLPSPVASNGEAYVVVAFSQDDKPALGSYPENPHDRTAKRYVSTSLIVNGESLGISLGASTAEIVELANGKVCGKFDLNGDISPNPGTTHIAGTFVAELAEK